VTSLPTPLPGFIQVSYSFPEPIFQDLSRTRKDLKLAKRAKKKKRNFPVVRNLVLKNATTKCTKIGASKKNERRGEGHAQKVKYTLNMRKTRLWKHLLRSYQDLCELCRKELLAVYL